MPLIELWKKSPDQLKDKQIKQLIAIAGTGSLADGNDCSTELRAFLEIAPSPMLVEFAEQCLSESFADSGFALQDVINEVGVRLGAEVERGRYRGKQNDIGHDGLWKFPNGHSIVIEVKTTDAYSIDLDKIAGYRRSLIADQKIKEESSSMLFVVGRKDTGGLEDQIRGSKYAWDLRIISIDALTRLMSVKEDMDDPKIIQQIHSILIPREFTRLDEIVNILYSASLDLKEETPPTPKEVVTNNKKDKEPKFTPVAFHESCIQRIQAHLKQPLIKRSRASYSTADKSLVVNCAISKEHDPDNHPNYWYAFHPHQREALKACHNSYIALGCGSSKRILLIPFNDFEPWISGMWTTESAERAYWHIVIFRDGEIYTLRRKKGEGNIDVTKYLLKIDV